MNMLQVIVLMFLTLLLGGCYQEKQLENGAAQAPTTSKAGPPAGAEPAPPPPVPVPPPPKPAATPLPAPESTSSRPTRTHTSARHPTAAAEARPGATAAHASNVATRAAPPKPDTLNQYAVKVSATSPITLDMNQSVKSAGQLAVWVGQPGFEPSTRAGMAAASRVLETAVKADTARITPVFSDPLTFNAEPKESKCQAVEPTGSEVTFAITPNKSGDFKVGASVELYQSADCSGAAITKTAEPITVQVKVAISSKPFLQGIFDAFMKFFYEILGVCVLALVALFRKKIFPFMDKSSGGSGQSEH